jgi:hypothetical protein
MREARIEKHLKDQVTKAGGKAYKAVWPGTNGCPDRVVLWPGRLDWVELKRPETSAAEAHQLRKHAELRASGQTVFVLPTKEAIDHYIELRTVNW